MDSSLSREDTMRDSLASDPSKATATGVAIGSAVGNTIAAAATPALALAVGGATAGAAFGIAAGAAVLGGAVVATYKCFRSGQQEYTSAYQPGQGVGEFWVVATEEGWGNVRTCRYTSEDAARKAFGKIWCARVLYSPQGDEVASGGLASSCETSRRVMQEHYFKKQ